MKAISRRSRALFHPIEAGLLTLSSCDFRASPPYFLRRHLQLFTAGQIVSVPRKIAQGAVLYTRSLTDEAAAMKRTEPKPGKFDRVLPKAVNAARARAGGDGCICKAAIPNEG